MARQTKQLNVEFKFKKNVALGDLSKIMKEFQAVVDSKAPKLRIDVSEVKNKLKDIRTEINQLNNLAIKLQATQSKAKVQTALKTNKSPLVDTAAEEAIAAERRLHKITNEYKTYSSLLSDVRKKMSDLSSRESQLKSKGIYDGELTKASAKLKAYETNLQKIVNHYDTVLKDINGERVGHISGATRADNSQALLKFRKQFGGLDASFAESIQRAKNEIDNLMTDFTRKSKIPTGTYDAIVKDQNKYNKALETSNSNLTKLNKLRADMGASGKANKIQLKSIDDAITDTIKLRNNLNSICSVYQKLNELARKETLTGSDQAAIKSHRNALVAAKSKFGQNLSTEDYVGRINKQLQGNMTFAQATKTAVDLEANAEKASQKNIKQTISEFKNFSSLLSTVQSKKNSLITKGATAINEGFTDNNIQKAIAELNSLETQIQEIIAKYDILLQKMNGGKNENLNIAKKSVTNSQNELFGKTGNVEAILSENLQRTKNYVNEMSTAATRSYNARRKIVKNTNEYFALSDRSDMSAEKIKNIQNGLNTLKEFGYSDADINRLFPDLDKTIKDFETLSKSIKDAHSEYVSLISADLEKGSYIKGMGTADKKIHEQSFDKIDEKLGLYQSTLNPMISANTDANYASYRKVLTGVNDELTRMSELKAKIPQNSPLFPSLEKNIMQLKLYRQEYENFIRYQELRDNKIQGGSDINLDKNEEFFNKFSKEHPDAIDAQRYNANFASSMQKISASFDSSYMSARKLNTEFTKINNLAMKASSYASKFEVNLKKAGQFGNFQTFIKRANNGEFANFSDALDQLRKLQTTARAAGVETETFGSMFSKTFGSRIRSAMAGMGTFFITDSARAMFQNVENIDSAMTELKKVTDETNASYNKFLDNAQGRSKEIGTTLTNTINATADYARLGYSIEDATQLADSALIYFNVGDGLRSIDDATSSLISTMQGFQLEASDSMGIVDSFNEVSNHFATSSGKSDCLVI